MGNSAEKTGSINNWLYGDGGLNNTSINNYYEANKTTIHLNNEYVHSLNPNDLEYKAYRGSRSIDLNKEDLSSNFNKVPASHEFIIITGSKEFMNELLLGRSLVDKTSNLVEVLPLQVEMIEKGVGKEGEYFVTLGGYAGDKLTKNVNDESDTKYAESGYFNATEILFANNNEKENDLALIKNYQAYNGEATYPKLFGFLTTGVPNNEYYTTITGVQYRFTEKLQTYNSNSFVASICSYSNGTNCQTSFNWGNKNINSWAPGINGESFWFYCIFSFLDINNNFDILFKCKLY